VFLRRERPRADLVSGINYTGLLRPGGVRQEQQDPRRSVDTVSTWIDSNPTSSVPVSGISRQSSVADGRRRSSSETRGSGYCLLSGTSVAQAHLVGSVNAVLQCLHYARIRYRRDTIRKMLDSGSSVWVDLPRTFDRTSVNTYFDPRHVLDLAVSTYGLGV